MRLWNKQLNELYAHFTLQCREVSVFFWVSFTCLQSCLLFSYHVFLDWTVLHLVTPELHLSPLSSTCHPMSPLQSVMPHQRSGVASTTALFLIFWTTALLSTLWITSAFYLISGGFIIFPSSDLDKLYVAVGGCCWTRGLVLMAAIIGIIKNNESFYLHPLCFCSCLCPSSLDVVQWPRRCWVKGLSGSPWPSTLVSLWESWWLFTWQGECQVTSLYGHIHSSHSLRY